jgi:hypothetical protein
MKDFLKDVKKNQKNITKAVYMYASSNTKHSRPTLRS